MSFEYLISSIVTDFFAGDRNFLFLSLPEKIMSALPGLLDSSGINTIDLSKENSPLKPFMKIVQNYKPSSEEIEKNSYLLHRDFFRSYFESGKVSERFDTLIMDELFFEKKCVRNTVVKLFEKYVNNRWLILNAQELSSDSIEILKLLFENELNGKLIFCFDIRKLGAISNYVNDFIEELSRNDNFYELVNYEKSEDEEESVIQEAPVIAAFDDVISDLKALRIFLDLEGAENLSKWIIENLDSYNISSYKKSLLYFELSVIYYYLNKFDEASYYVTSLIEGQSLNDVDLIVRGYILMARILFAKNNCVAALQYSNLALQRLENEKKSQLYALTCMMDYRISEKLNSGSSYKKYIYCVELLKSCGLVNCAVNTTLIMPMKLTESDEGRRLLKPKVEEAMQEAKWMGNLFALSTAYHWSGIFISYIQGSTESLDWYYKCNEIRTEIGELSSMIKIKNGLAYEYLIRSEYEKAYNLINDFLDRIIEINDYPEIIITLCNISKAMLFARQFDQAYTVLQKIIYLQHLFGLEEVPYNSFVPVYNDILIFKSIIDFIHGETINTKITLNNISGNGRSITGTVKPFIDFLWAMIEAREKNLEGAFEHFEKAVSEFKKFGASQDSSVCFIFYEFAFILNEEGFKSESEKVTEEGFKYAKERNLDFYVRGKEFLTVEEYVAPFKEFKPLNINLDVLVEQAEKEKLMVQLQKRLRDSQFLNRIMGFASNRVNEINYVNNVAQAIFDYTMAEGVFVAAKEMGGWKVLAHVSRSELVPPSGPELNSYLKKSSQKENINIYYDKEKNLFVANISKFEFTGAVVILPSQNLNSMMEGLDAISIALSNLQAHIVMLKQNENLMFISSTDQLSMLKNRRALQEQLGVQSEMIRRYSSNRDKFFQVSVEFIDLDNFKYYNDNFGHDAGDFFISKFGELLRNIFRKVDFISRFGGDEFVVLLSNTGCNEAKRSAERLYQALKDEEYFIPELSKLLHKKISVPENRRIGFSVGICSNYDIENHTDMEEVMSFADKTLYYVKENCKGTVKTWSEIKNLV